MMPSQYLTVAELVNAPLGLSLRSVPPHGATGPTGVTGQQTYEELTNIILRASALADSYCQQILASTTDSEEKWSNGGEAGVDKNGYLWVHTNYWPIIAVNAFQYGFPTTGAMSWIVVPTSDIVMFRTRLIYAGLLAQRGMPPLRIQYTYQNGWPHTLLTGTVVQGSMTIPVVDATGIVAGSALTINDEGNTEIITVSTAWVPVTGPANVQLAFGTAFAHTPIFRPAVAPTQPYDISLSALPADIKEAVLLICKQLVETRGANALVMGRAGGVRGSTAKQEASAETLPAMSQSILNHYRRMI